jgi:hypothetical protein
VTSKRIVPRSSNYISLNADFVLAKASLTLRRLARRTSGSGFFT